MDWTAIHFAASRMPSAEGVDTRSQEAAEFVNQKDFLEPGALPEITLAENGLLTFASPLPSPFPENNTALARLYRCGDDWRSQPVVILVHGWNDAINHFVRFPKMALKFNERGVNEVTLELPYHFSRRLVSIVRL